MATASALPGEAALLRFGRSCGRNQGGIASEMNELRRVIGSAVEVLWGPGPIDAVQEFFGPGWDWFFSAVTFFATITAVVVVLSLALWLAGRRLAYALIGAVLLAAAVDSLLWTLVGVPRPDAAQIVVRAHPGVSSFPSGHVVTSTVVYGLLALRGRIPVAVPVVAVPVIGLSRLYPGAHYLGDVLGGLLIGLLILTVFHHLWPKVAGRLARLPLWLFVLAGLCAPVGILLVMGTTPRGWELFAVALAMGLGMPLEYRYVRFEPNKTTLWRRVAEAAVGLTVMGALLLAHGLLFDGRAILASASLALAVLWGVLGAPALFARLTPSAHGRDDRRSW
jgi:membrane-associated phospholipid phosphatase